MSEAPFAPSPLRRLLLAALLCAPWLACASTPPVTGLQRWGSGSYRRFGFLVYEATLWAGDHPQQPPLALQLTYRRSIAGKAIAAASVKEMRALGDINEDTLAAWGERMAALFPDVKDGDRILGEYHPDVARFYYNGVLLGEIADARFARQFFAIWLDVRTSAPELRAALLRRGGPAG